MATEITCWKKLIQISTHEGIKLTPSGIIVFVTLTNFLFAAFAHISFVKRTFVKCIFCFRINSQRYFAVKQKAPSLD